MTRLKNKRTTVIAILAVFIVVCACWYFLTPSEPSYKGRRLSEWVRIMRNKAPGTEADEARLAVRKLAPDCIPLLLDWLREEDTHSFEEKLNGAYEKLIRFLLRLHAISKPPSATFFASDTGLARSFIASRALLELDHPSRMKVIPVLIQMLAETNADTNSVPYSAGMSYSVLSAMGPEAIQPLINSLTNQHRLAFYLAAGALRNMGTNAAAAIPVFREFLGKEDAGLVIFSADILDKLGDDPSRFMPQLTAALPRADEPHLEFALETILNHKSHAAGVVPALRACAEKFSASSAATNAWVGLMITNAILELERPAPPEEMRGTIHAGKLEDTAAVRDKK